MTTNTFNQIVALALQEDIGSGDLTANLIPATQQSCAKIITRQEAVLCGTQFVDAVYQQLRSMQNAPNNSVTVTWHAHDGDRIKPQQTLCTIEGTTRLILSGERSALNFLQTLSSTATLTERFVTQIAGTKAQLLDTRKTLPGLRDAQKYAVICGGGHNHRFGLYDAVLIKENHIAAHGSITKAVTAARAIYPHQTIEVEVQNLEELREALSLPIDRIMLDNFTLEQMRSAVAISCGKIKLEVSGNVTLDNIRAIAATGVDYISTGALTKTVIPIDFSLLST